VRSNDVKTRDAGLRLEVGGTGGADGFGGRRVRGHDDGGHRWVLRDDPKIGVRNGRIVANVVLAPTACPNDGDPYCF
jgi:hypothetical protein